MNTRSSGPLFSSKERNKVYCIREGVIKEKSIRIEKNYLILICSDAIGLKKPKTL